MTRIRTVLIAGSAGALAMAWGIAGGNQPAGAEEISFKGQRLNAIIGSQPGGGTDGTTRLVGRFLEKYLPGQPQILFRNMPAGHGVKATNFFANEAKRDGTYWMGGSSPYVDANNLRKPVVEYDPRTFEYIGAVARGGSVITIRKAKLPNLTDKSMPPVIIGEIDGTRSWAQLLQWGAEYLGWNIKFVIGYPGSAALMLAARRGEIDSFGTSGITIHRDLAKTGDFVNLAQLGEKQGGKVVPRITFPDVPVMTHMLEGKLSGLAKEAFEYWSKTNQIDKWYALPPKTPKNIVVAYRAAYDKVVKDPEFIKFGRLQFSEDFSPQTDEDILDLVNTTSYPTVEISKFLQDLKVKQGLPATPLSSEEMAKLAAERGGVLKAKTELVDIKREGRQLFFMNGSDKHQVKISGSRTQVMIGGKKSKRGELKVGMKCEISYPTDKSEAMSVSCE